MLDIYAYFTIFAIGLSYGATACMFSCMPFLTPLLIVNSGSTKQGLSVVLPFSLGRIFSYTLLAIVAYLSSYWIKKVLDDTSTVASILGIVTISMGCFIFYKSFQADATCKTKKVFMKDGKRFGFFTIGALMAINPCAPLLTLVGVAINSKVLMSAALNGLFFGVGAVLFSVILYGVIFSKLIVGMMTQLRAYKSWIERAMALFLVVLGIQVMLGNVVL